MKKRVFRILGIIFLLNSFSGVTGFVIVEEISTRISGILGLVFILVNVILMLVSREKGSELEASVKEAIKQGVPAEEARKLFEEAKEKVNSGEWVELKVFRVRSAADQKKYPHGTSLCRYWGSEEYKEESQSRLDALYKLGKIGKTHEIVRGSDKYVIGGRLSKGTVSIPTAGSRVLHRHWEIAQMYKYKKEEQEE